MHQKSIKDIKQEIFNLKNNETKLISMNNYKIWIKKIQNNKYNIILYKNEKLKMDKKLHITKLFSFIEKILKKRGYK